jgi:hypothetical protein
MLSDNRKENYCRIPFSLYIFFEKNFFWIISVSYLMPSLFSASDHAALL